MACWMWNEKEDSLGLRVDFGKIICGEVCEEQVSIAVKMISLVLNEMHVNSQVEVFTKTLEIRICNS